ncbi:MAG: hypothetical protein SGILL_005525 [Bacillariaceae sp.]
MSLRHPHTLATLEFVSLMGTGLMAGATAYITLVEVPGRADKSPKYQLENYHEIFPRAMKLLKNTGMVATVFCIATGYLTKKVEWGIPVACFGGLGPFTAIFIAPTNDMLMAATDGDKVKKELQDWGKLHSIRTYAAVIGFAGAIAAVMDLNMM